MTTKTGGFAVTYGYVGDAKRYSVDNLTHDEAKKVVALLTSSEYRKAGFCKVQLEQDGCW